MAFIGLLIYFNLVWIIVCLYRRLQFWKKTAQGFEKAANDALALAKLQDEQLAESRRLMGEGVSLMRELKGRLNHE